MTFYAMIITYNFDGDSITKGFKTREEAIQCMNDFLNEEVEINIRENDYKPLVQKWNEDDITLVYAEEDAPDMDKAYYRVFLLERME